MKLVRYVLVALCLIVGVTAVFAQENAALPQVTVNFADGGYAIEGDITPGLITFVFNNNNADAPVLPFVGRLNPDVTEEAFNQAMGGEGMEALMMMSMLGGLQVAPGESKMVTFNLQAGTHILTDFNSQTPSAEYFNVEGEASTDAAALEADVNVRLLDFAFSLPLEIPAGAQTWQIANEGTQWHELAMMPIDENLSIAELRDLMGRAAAGEEMETQPNFFWAPISQGERAWVDVDLEPGSYLVVCFLPDFNSGHAHADLGMVQIIHVGE